MRVLCYMVIMVIAFSFAPQAHAAGPLAKGKGANTQTISGTVVGFKGKAMRLTISFAGDDGSVKERTFRTSEQTKVTLNGNPVPLSALRAGLRVTVTANRRLATEIAATSGPAGAH